LRLPDLANKQHLLSDWRGKVLVVNFWATWCVPCKKELTNIHQMYEQWQKDYGVQIIAISIDDARNRSKVKAFAEGQGWDYVVLIDQNQELKRALNFQTVPYTLMLDKNGNKMSKRLGNAVDPFETLNAYGADSTRWYLIENAPPWENLKFNLEHLHESQRRFFGTLFNTYQFFALYANIDGWRVEQFDRVPREQLTELVGRVSLKEIVRESTDLIERLCIEAALTFTGNNRASAAEILGLSRQSLYSKLHRHGLGNLVSEAG